MAESGRAFDQRSSKINVIGKNHWDFSIYHWRLDSGPFRGAGTEASTCWGIPTTGLRFEHTLQSKEEKWSPFDDKMVFQRAWSALFEVFSYLSRIFFSATFAPVLSPSFANLVSVLVVNFHFRNSTRSCWRNPTKLAHILAATQSPVVISLIGTVGFLFHPILLPSSTLSLMRSYARE